MKTTAATPILSEPSHDEIALTAFLQWEKDGRQSGRDTFYWNQAENQLLELYRQKAERTAAAQTARAWPVQPLVPAAKPTPVKPASSAKRSTKPKTPAAPVTAPVAVAAPVIPAKRETQPVRMATAVASPTRLAAVHPAVAAAKAGKSTVGSRAATRR